ncbi:YitT family protein [Bacillus sp. JJ1122]|uniref:YitT family protein n=1 Tax=Bacillus sp. JJ1122 TaxID=3122951 RepID=UPI002FFEBFE3
MLVQNKKLYDLANFLFLYLNVFVAFGVIYLFLDIFQLGPLIDPSSLKEQPKLFAEKLENAFHLSGIALFFEDTSKIVPSGWSRAVANIEQAVGFLLPAFIMIKFSPEENEYRSRSKISFRKIIFKSVFVIVGALFVSLALEFFLIPNHIIDGGIVGVSIIMSYLTGLKLEFYLLFLNLPFLYLGYKKIGKRFVVTTLLGITVLSLGTLVLYNVPVPTGNPLLASLFGGIFLGVGVGIVIRYGGSLDGTEILGILLNRRTSFSVGKVIMFINIFVFSSAGFIFGWDKALLSLAAYYIASNMIDVTLERFG